MTVPLEPWGWKVTISVYGTGAKPKGDIIKATQAAADVLEADVFAGARVDVVQARPSEQVAS